MMHNSICSEKKALFYHFCESTEILLTGCFGSVSVEKLLGLLLTISSSRVSCVGLKRGMYIRAHLEKIHI